MSVAPGDILEVKARMELHGSVVMNVFYVENGAGTNDDIDVKDDLIAWVNDGYVLIEDIQGIDLNATDVDIINITQDYHIGTDSWLDYNGGTIAFDALASQDAGLISFPVNRLGSRGRKFIPGIVESQTELSLFLSTAFEALGDFGFYFYQPFTGFVTSDGYTPVLRRQIGSPAIFEYVPFTGFSVSSVVARMGSRKKGVGI